MIERLLAFLAGEALGLHVHQQQMIIRAAAHEAEPIVFHAFGQRLGVHNYLLLIFLKLRR